MQLAEVASATGGALHNGDPMILRVSTDTRSIGAGELFVALRGDRFDGHAFLDVAATRGASAALVDHTWLQAHALALPHVAVEDTRLAFGALAAAWRARFDLPLLGVTGSNGKTAVKEMSAAILRAQAGADGHDPRLAVLATRGNLNNDIGVPLTLLELNAAHRAAVVEMGMNRPGEIAYLSALARPTVALVNNAQRAHLEGVGSLSAVVREKGAIYSGLGSDGVAIVNADDPFCDYWRSLNAGRKVVSFGLDPSADVTADYAVKGLNSSLCIKAPQGSFDVVLRVPGLHNVRNALAACAAALSAGASLDALRIGLGGFEGVRGRLKVRKALAGASVLDDTYNANPDSVRAAIDVLASTPERKILVLGDMGEIGDQAAQFHDEVGGYAKSQGIDLLFALGEHSELAARNFDGGGRHFGSVDELVAALLPELAPGTTVLVKGSRFMRMERVADAIAQRAED
jgi:UDP-N-acetylmuramoyl-tripeptide--D-alanyl-D-alanine ligase